MSASVLPEVIELKEIDTQVLLFDYQDDKQGKIIIDHYGKAYSYYWGSMRSSLKRFLATIDSGYFAHKVTPVGNEYVMDVDKTMTGIRKFIREDIGLKFYEHMEFQKTMREKLTGFQNELRDIDAGYVNQYFVDRFPSVVDDITSELSFCLNSHEQKRLANDLESMLKTECWNFIVKSPSQEYRYMLKLHKLLKARFEKEAVENTAAPCFN